MIDSEFSRRQFLSCKFDSCVQVIIRSDLPYTDEQMQFVILRLTRDRPNKF